MWQQRSIQQRSTNVSPAPAAPALVMGHRGPGSISLSVSVRSVPTEPATDPAPDARETPDGMQTVEPALPAPVGPSATASGPPAPLTADLAKDAPLYDEKAPALSPKADHNPVAMPPRDTAGQASETSIARLSMLEKEVSKRHRPAFAMPPVRHCIRERGGSHYSAPPPSRSASKAPVATAAQARCRQRDRNRDPSQCFCSDGSAGGCDRGGGGTRTILQLEHNQRAAANDIAKMKHDLAEGGGWGDHLNSTNCKSRGRASVRKQRHQIASQRQHVAQDTSCTLSRKSRLLCLPTRTAFREVPVLWSGFNSKLRARNQDRGRFASDTTNHADQLRLHRIHGPTRAHLNRRPIQDSKAATEHPAGLSKMAQEDPPAQEEQQEETDLRMHPRSLQQKQTLGRVCRQQPACARRLKHTERTACTDLMGHPFDGARDAITDWYGLMRNCLMASHPSYGEVLFAIQTDRCPQLREAPAPHKQGPT